MLNHNLGLQFFNWLTVFEKSILFNEFSLTAQSYVYSYGLPSALPMVVLRPPSAKQNDSTNESALKYYIFLLQV